MKYIIAISRTVAIDDYNSINALIDQGWNPCSNDDIFHSMMVKLFKTFEVELSNYGFFKYINNLNEFCTDFTVEWYEQVQ